MRELRRLACLTLLFAASTAFGQVPPPEADLAVTKTGPASATAGSNVTYTITIANNGPDPAVDATLSDEIPTGMTFVSLTQNSGPIFSCTTPASGSGGEVTCSLASLAVGASAQFTLVTNVPAATAPGTAFVNLATGTSTTFDPFDENNTGVAGTSTPAAPQPDMSVAKSGPVSAGPGRQVTYTVTVRNAGGATATNVTLSDTLPGPMTFVSLTQSGSPTLACTTPAVGAGGTITCTAASFPAGATTVVTLTAEIPAATARGVELTNTATVASDTDANEENNVSSTTLLVTEADLAIAKSGPPTAPAGNISYGITLSNTGPDLADGAGFTDVLPAGTTFVSLTQTSGPAATCVRPAVGTNGTVSCTIPVFFLAGQTAQFTLTLRAAESGTVTNTANVTSDTFDPDPSDNTSTATTSVTPNADVAVTKTGPATIVAGTNATYTIAVANNGPSTATNVTLTDAVAPGTTFVSFTQTAGPAFTCTTGSTVTCTIASLAPSTTATFTLVTRAGAGTAGTLTNTATVASSTPDPNVANNTSTAASGVTASSDVAVTKSGPATANAGSNVTYTLNVTNNGPSNAGTVTLADAVPANATFVSVTQTAGPAFNCAAAGGAVTCTANSLAAAATATFSLVVRLDPAAGGTVANTATVTVQGSTDPAPANNTSTATTTVTTSADLTVTKSAPANAAAGTNVTYTVGVSNAGPSNAAGVTLNDVLPANTTFVSATQTSGPAFTCTPVAAGAATTINCTAATLASGAAATFSFVVRIDPAATGPITNTATVAAATPDPNSTNNTASATTGTSATVAVDVAKNGPPSAPANTDITYTITVANGGPSTATAVTLTDAIPNETTFVSISQTSGPAFTCTNPGAGNGGSVTCTAPALAPGTPATFSLVVHVSPTAVGPISNTASVTYNANATPGSSSSTTATAVTPGTTDVRIVKTVASPAETSRTTTFTLAVTNDGPSTASGVVVTDVLPAGTTLVSYTATQGTCTGTTTVTCTVGTLLPATTATVALVVRLPALPAALTNTATVASANADTNPANNASTVTFGVTQAAEIPTASEWGLIVLALGLAGAALVMQRR